MTEKTSKFQRGIWLAGITLLFLSSFAIRLYRLDAPGMLPVREYRSALIARAYYFTIEHDDIPEWRREIARINQAKEWTLEPPLVEWSVARLQKLLGVEALVLARILLSGLWITGGLLMFQLVRRMSGTESATYSTAYYLLAPLGILTSRSFQPDSLMVLLLLATLLSVYIYSDHKSFHHLVVAGGWAGFTLLLRPLPVFVIGCSFVALIVGEKSNWKAIFTRDGLIFAALALLPSIAYYGYSFFITGSLIGQADQSFRPALYFRREFWEQWLLVGVQEVGFVPLAIALVGLAMASPGRVRNFLIGLWTEYGMFGLLFNYHIHTHGYYHLQLVLIVAFSFGPALAFYRRSFSHQQDRFWLIPTAALLILLLVYGYRDVRGGLYRVVFERPATARHIGEIVHHSDRVIYLAHHYGLPLIYYGEFAGAYWPRSITYWLYREPGETERTVGQRMRELNFIPEYVVITAFDEYETHHQDLKDYLVAKCHLLATDDEYIVFDECAAAAKPQQN